MQRMLTGLAGGLAIALALSAADAATFSTTPIILDGNINVNLTAINAAGTIVGDTYANITDAASGIIMSAGAVTTLPPPYYAQGAAFPQAIDPAGNIAGYAPRSAGGYPNLFYWDAAKKVYLTAYDIAVNTSYTPGLQTVVNTIGMAAGGKIFFNDIFALDQSDIMKFGVPAALQTVPDLSQYNRLTSMNESEQVAGVEFSRFGAGSVFTGDVNGYTTLLPPNARNASGGYINKSGAVAGSYNDTSNKPHGFIYKNGKYASFDIPDAASGVAVTAYTDGGRVAGVFTGANGVQHGFLYSGGTVSSFGVYGEFETISIAANDVPTLVVARQFPDQKPNYESFVLTCAGAGC